MAKGTPKQADVAADETVQDPHATKGPANAAPQSLAPKNRGSETTVAAPKSDVVLAGDATTVAKGFDETLAESLWPRYAQPELGEFGDYELLEKLGEGGMGIVYRARQKAANRIVALKVIHTSRPGSQRADTRAKALERFRIEAQAAAQLDHENIVPVYDVGEVGEHVYFSMRLVDGTSLNDLLKDGPLEQRRAAQYITGVVSGVAEAHRRGVLHRDLKPHNVMLDVEKDRPLVADFGLAKVVEADDQVTRQGEVLGTPSYMPPEQISSAGTVDKRADIYALGATLYHLLVGRPPFQAANTLATMRQVLYQEPVAPRELNVAVDRDLDTICVKCLQKEPAKRYQTAEELNDDLKRYLEGRPIQARPISLPERVVRWSRRNPLAAGLAGLALVLAAGVFAATAIGYRNTSAALAQSEKNHRLARQSINELYTDVSEIDLENAPGMQPLKEKLLARSLGYYEKLLADRDDAQSQADVAATHFRVGSIYDQLGKGEEAREHFVQAEKMQTEMAAANPDDAAMRLALSDTHNELGRLAQRSGDLARAAKEFGESAKLRQALVAQLPADVELRRKLANSEMNRGLLAVREEKLDEADKLYESAQKVRNEILAKGENAAVEEDLAKGFFNQGALAAKREQWDAAAENFHSAIAKFEALVKEHPDSLKYRYRLAMSQSMLADMLQLAGKRAEAAESFGAALANLQSLVDESPLVDEYQEQLTTMQIGEAQLEMQLGREAAAAAVAAGAEDGEQAEASEEYYREAEASLAVARERLARLVERRPDQHGHRYNLAVTLQLLGDVQLAFNSPEEARKLFEQAMAQLNGVPVENIDAERDAALRQTIEASLAALPSKL